jgi:uroporphyrinogen-III synthase
MKRTLYLGSNPKPFQKKLSPLVHYPILSAQRRPFSDSRLNLAFSCFSEYTHILLTSPQATTFFYEWVLHFHLTSILKEKKIVCVGKQTAASVKNLGLLPFLTAIEETQEGLIQTLRTLNLGDSYFFFPRSSLSRRQILHFFHKREIRAQVCDLYDTSYRLRSPLPNLKIIDRIFFTSPSTVEGFLHLYTEIPSSLELLAIGKVTLEALQQQSRLQFFLKRIFS